MDSTQNARAWPVTVVAVLVLIVGILTHESKGFCEPPATNWTQSTPAGQREPTGKSAKAPASAASKLYDESVDWHSLIPEIRAALREGLHYEVRSVGISKEADITGDGVPESLVYTGHGGASTDSLALMRIEDGKPILARIKNRDGKIYDPGFLVGSSVTHGDSTEMLPDEKAIFWGSYSMNNTGTGFSSCDGKVYRWNPKTKTFEWDEALSKRITQTYCEREKKALIR